MKIEDLKKALTQGNIPETLIVFKCPNDTFVAKQYVQEMARILEYDIQYDDLESVESHRNSPFYMELPELVVITCDKLDFIKNYSILNHVVIITKEVSDMINSAYVVSVPELEDWMIKDYICSNFPSLEKEDSEFLQKVLTDINRADLEVQRYSAFSEVECATAVSKAIRDGLYDDLIDFALTDLGNAIKARDISKVIEILKHNPVKTDKDLLSLVGLLRSGFKSVWSIRLSSGIMHKLKVGAFVTDLDGAAIGMEGKKIYAISKSAGFTAYPTQKLTQILMFLNSFNKNLITGKLPDSLEDKMNYILINILG